MIVLEIYLPKFTIESLGTSDRWAPAARAVGVFSSVYVNSVGFTGWLLVIHEKTLKFSFYPLLLESIDLYLDRVCRSESD